MVGVNTIVEKVGSTRQCFSRRARGAVAVVVGNARKVRPPRDHRGFCGTADRGGCITGQKGPPSTGQMIDETLAIERVLQGDTESFRLLVERYEKRVVRMIRNITGTTQSSEDLAQDVFLTAFAKLRSFDPARSRFSTWLLTIARNKSINHLKKKHPRTRYELPVHVDGGTPLAALIQREAFARLDRALAMLPGHQRRAFVLAEFEGLPYEQIARIEGTRIGTIKSRASRARAKLTDALRQYEANDQ